MQAYDLFMLIVLVGAVVWGAWKGFAWQIASLASMVASYVVALSFRQPLSTFINASPPWNIFLSMLILFLGTSLIVWIGFNLVAELIEKVKLKEFDRQVGAIFGLAKGVLLCVLITSSVTLLSEPQRQAICNSKSGYYIAILLDKADAVIPSEVHGVLDPYIDRLDREITHPHTEGGGFHLPELPALPKNLLGGQGADSPLDGSGLSGFPAPREIIRAKPATGSFGSDPERPDAASRPAAAPRRW